MNARIRQCAVLMMSYVVLFGCGCSKSVPSIQERRFRVTGSILVNGKPAAHALLTFFPVDEPLEKFMAKAIANEDGDFKLSVALPKDGAKPVEYRVGISWRIPGNPEDRKDPEYGEELLPEKFQNPSESGVVVEIQPAQKELDTIELNFSTT